MDAIKILIVDDSMFFREILGRGLIANLPVGSTVEKAENPFEARDKILAFDPDVMVLDVEMPKMNGIEFLRRLIVQYNLPTVVLSSRPAYKTLAMEAGAFTFLEKPSTTLGSGSFVKQVAAEIRLAKENADMQIKKAAQAAASNPVAVSGKAATSVSRGTDSNLNTTMQGVVDSMREMKEHNQHLRVGTAAPKSAPHPVRSPRPTQPVKLIAIGASTGGTEALATVLHDLHPPLPPIVIVQHIPPMFSRLFAERLNNECDISVKEAENGDHLEDNWVYVAPGDKQMRVKNMGGLMTLDVNPGPKVNGHCPSVDVLFESVAERVGAAAMGAILTGMGEDGARCLLKMRQAGCVTLGQDEASCVVYGMPRAAFEFGAVVQQLPLSAMASMITTVARYREG